MLSQFSSLSHPGITLCGQRLSRDNEILVELWQAEMTPDPGAW